MRTAVQEAGPARHGDAWLLGLGRGRDTQRPDAHQIRHEILPVLHRILESDPQRDLRSAWPVAIAKIGVDIDWHPLIPALRVHLTSHAQEIRETVDERTGAFATYGPGLAAWASGRAAVKRIAMQVLDTLLAQRVRASQLLAIAALDAIGLLPPDFASDADAAGRLRRSSPATGTPISASPTTSPRRTAPRRSLRC